MRIFVTESGCLSKFFYGETGISVYFPAFDILKTICMYSYCYINFSLTTLKGNFMPRSNHTLWLEKKARILAIIIPS